MKRLFYRLFYFSYAVKQPRRKRFTTRGLIVLSGVVVTAFLGLDTNQSLTYQIFTFLVSLLVVSRISGLWFRFRKSLLKLQNLEKNSEIILIKY